MAIKMRVIKPFEHEWREESPIDAFDLNGNAKPRISIIGAGGKTTTLESLAMDYYNRKQQAIVTTTTHMFYPDDKWVFTESTDMSKIKYKLKKHIILWMGIVCEQGKISGVSEKLKEEMEALSCPILVEADGARRLPFKMPGENEPVLFPKTTCVVAVLGLDALHKKIGEVSFRKEVVAKFLGKTEEDVLEEVDFIKIINSRQGLQKYVTEEMEFKVILNKADTNDLTQHALRIRDTLNMQGKKSIYITSHR